MGDYELYTAPSNLLNQEGNSIGRGLFAFEDIKKGKKIGEYEGMWVETSAATADTYISDYVFEIDEEWSIDANDYPRSLPRYANDPVDPKLANAVLRPENQKVYLFATKNIKAHNEIFVSYGPSYWMDTFHIERLNGDGQHFLMQNYPEVRAFIQSHYHT